MASDTSENKRKEILDAAWGRAPAAGNTEELRDAKGHYAFARYTIQGDHYVGFYQTWVKSILFLLGRQWLKWMSGSRRFVMDTSVPPWRQQPVTNICYAIYRSIETKLKKQKPTLEVVPPSGDSAARESASLGSAILEELWRRLKFPLRIRRALGWFICTGQVYLRVWWDEEAGELIPFTRLEELPQLGADGQPDPSGATEDVPIALDEQGNPHLDDAGNFDLGAEPAMVPEGEIAFSVIDPLCVRHNPEADDPEDADEQYVATLWPKHEALAHFDLPETDLYSGGDGDRQMYDDLISSAAAGPGWLNAVGMLGSQIGSSQDSALGDRVLVIEFYSRKDPRKYPKGRHWITIGPVMVWPKADDADYPTGEAPLPGGFWPPVLGVFATPIPGQPQAMGVLPQIVPLNEQYNTVDAKILEHEALMAMGGKYIAHPDDKGMTINSDPGQVLFSKGYALGKPPMQLRLEALPGEVYGERTVMLDKVRLVASLSESDLAQKGEGSPSGRQFLVKQEVVDSVIAPDLEAWEHALEEVGRRCLQLAQTHYIETRKVKIRGERGQWEVRSFDRSDLTDGLEVRVQVGSSFPWSKSAQWDTKLEVLGKFPALVMKPDGTIDREAFAHFLDVGSVGLSGFESDEDPDMVEITREHAMFEVIDPAQGQAQTPQIAFWQNHAVHLAEHYRFMKRDYARYERWTPEAQDAFKHHMLVTMQAVDKLAGIAAAAAGEQGGADATAPGPGDGGDGGAAPPDGSGPPNLSVSPGGAGGSKSLTKPQLQPADFAAAGSA